MGCEQTEEEVAQLRQLFGDVRVTAEPSGNCWIRIGVFPLPPHWPVPSTRLALRASFQYPVAKLDLIYVDPALRAIRPDMLAVMGTENVDSEEWLRISWHWNGPWDPARQNLVTFVRSARAYFRL